MIKIQSELEARLKRCIADNLMTDASKIDDDMRLMDLGDSMDASEIWMDIEDHFKLVKGQLHDLFTGEYGEKHTNILQASVGEIALCIDALLKNEVVPKFH